jgi:hypothetical protein
VSPSKLLRIAATSVVALACVVTSPSAHACCPAPPSGKPVVNADQTVVIAWDAASKTEHFIRRASWKSDADDFGFLVPTPAQPELEEAGDDAFPFLAKLTAPEIIRKPRPSEGCAGCAGGLSRSKSATASAPPPQVVVLEEKTVAGFHAVVLEAKSAGALVGWLKEHGYAFSPEVEAWAKPYVDGGWKITALRVAKDDAAKAGKGVSASSLRMSFKTERPLFPYREPDTSASASALGATDRLLRIYFIGDTRFDGELTKDHRWTGTVAWSGKLTAADRDKAIALLRLPAATTPPTFWLTEFEDHWPYRVAPADLTFARSATTSNVRREPIVEYTSSTSNGDLGLTLASLALVHVMVSTRRRKR